ncbi:MAG: TerD family protein [Succinivibrionaceae bacterium]|jgi:tellurium resistance protein TerD|nr:TerD family protein [Succinivibrionaceae bacterium]MCI6199701.1 TerD family protein [Pseudomonadota bacterium]MDY3145711.1 TerD family protein [Succinivibrionaceae bacterium]MDY6273445.1 TerD family protein [Succinivibrionaceae bacterium]MDY6337077.1 TerD family protein [Succinivibrionaceae bacterium]
MAIELEKGQRIGIKLEKVGVGLGWDPNEGSGDDFDLDASAFMLGENHKLPRDEFFVFYNNLKSPDGAVESMGDDRTGGSSDGDDETLNVDLSKVDPRVTEIIFTATIYKAAERRQNFGQVHNSYIRLYNAITNEEIARYDLDEDFSIETAIEFGRIYRRGSEWRFEALGLGNKGGMQALVDKYA